MIGSGMPYHNVGVHILYQSVLSSTAWVDVSSTVDDTFVKAKAWVEAENLVEVWALIQQWFVMMENDTADHQYPTQCGIVGSTRI